MNGGATHCCMGSFYDVGCDTDCPSKRAPAPTFKPHIRANVNPMLAGYQCQGLGVAGFGSTPEAAGKQWLQGLDMVHGREARRLYAAATANDPQVHCNRFPAAHELSLADLQPYLIQAAQAKN